MMGGVHRHRAGAGVVRGEQLGLFAADSGMTAPTAPSVPATPAAAPPVAPAAAVEEPFRESNDMALVRAVLAAADRHGYFLTEVGVCWRAGVQTDVATDHVALVEPEPAEAAMVAQLLARGWLQRSTRRRRRAGLRRGRSSGKRRVELEVHPLTVVAAARAAHSRWSSLAAVPAQRTPNPDQP